MSSQSWKNVLESAVKYPLNIFTDTFFNFYQDIMPRKIRKEVNTPNQPQTNIITRYNKTQHASHQTVFHQK